MGDLGCGRGPIASVLTAIHSQVRNVVQRASYDVPDAAVSRPQSTSGTPRETGRDAILCSRLRGHQAATTCALVTSDAGAKPCLRCKRR